jgi:hypothetical protein
MSNLSMVQRDPETDIDTRIPTLLTKSIADAICEKVREGGVLIPRELRDNPRTSVMEVYTRDEDGELNPFPILINPVTVKAWYGRHQVVRETGETFRSMVDKAREEHALLKEKELRKETIASAKQFIKTVQSLPKDSSYELSETNSTETIKEGNRTTTKRTKKVKDSRPNERVLELTLDACKFVLERLDPDFMPKEHHRNDVAILTLADLRRYQREQSGDL